MYNSVSLSALTAPVIIGSTLLIAVFRCAIIKRTTIARLCWQMLIFIIMLQEMWVVIADGKRYESCIIAIPCPL